VADLGEGPSPPILGKKNKLQKEEKLAGQAKKNKQNTTPPHPPSP